MSNNVNEIIAAETDDMVIVKDTPLLNLPCIKTLHKGKQYEDLCTQIVECTIMSGMLYEYYPLTSDDNNLWVKLHYFYTIMK